MHGFSIFKKHSLADSSVAINSGTGLSNATSATFTNSATTHAGDRILLKDTNLETRYRSAHRSRSTPDNIILRRESSYKSFTSAVSNKLDNISSRDNASHLIENSVIVLSNH